MCETVSSGGQPRENELPVRQMYHTASDEESVSSSVRVSTRKHCLRPYRLIV